MRAGRYHYGIIHRFKNVTVKTSNHGTGPLQITTQEKVYKRITFTNTGLNSLAYRGTVLTLLSIEDIQTKDYQNCCNKYKFRIVLHVQQRNSYTHFCQTTRKLQVRKTCTTHKSACMCHGSFGCRAVSGKRFKSAIL